MLTIKILTVTSSRTQILVRGLECRDFSISSPPPAAAVAIVDAMLTAYRHAVIQAAYATLMPEKNDRSGPWISDGTLQLIHERQQTMERVLQLMAQQRVLLEIGVT